MKKIKHYGFAAAALLASGAAAQAADLPFRKAAPVEYVRICDAFGEGFFYIPGTDTCLRITGQVRAEYSFRGKAPTDNRAAYAYNLAGTVYRRDLTNFRARGYLNADSRTQTAYGTLRAFASLRMTRDTTSAGPIGGRGELGVAGVPAGTRVSTGLFQGGDPSGIQSNLDKGFIQFAGITAGRAQSFFDFDAQSYELLTNTVANSNQVTELLSYTATFGGGFSATLSVEDATERRIGDIGAFVFSPTNPLPAGFGVSALNGSQNSPNATASGGRGQAGILAYGGERLPDFVGNVRYDGGWGSAQLSAAYHQVTSVPVSVLTGAGAGLAQGANITPKSADGFAVLAGVKILLPMLAKGDSLTLQGTYQQGAMDYANSVNYVPVGLTNVFSSTTTGLGQSFTVPINDAFVRTNGTIGLSKATGFFGAFRHYFIPSVYSSVYGTYMAISNPIQAQRLGAGTDSADIFQVGVNTIWVPAKDFQIGAEVLYTNLHYKVSANGLTAAALGTTPQDPDDYRARLSLRKAF